MYALRMPIFLAYATNFSYLRRQDIGSAFEAVIPRNLKVLGVESGHRANAVYYLFRDRARIRVGIHLLARRRGICLSRIHHILPSGMGPTFEFSVGFGNFLRSFGAKQSLQSLKRTVVSGLSKAFFTFWFKILFIFHRRRWRRVVSDISTFKVL